MPSRRELANAIRALSMDAVEKANSGHPGAPMGMADIAEVLWNDFLSHNPRNPGWANRDRVVMSNGHGSMLSYALLHLSGYDLPMAELENFRQLHSRTPGHPEYGVTPGIETTTGPLGQGLANAVGMAIAERVLAARFNRDGYPVVDHRTYAFVGDGCLMEGISHEACSLAGTLGLGKLVVFYDDNGISIDGDVRGWFTDDTAERFRAYGWQVLADVDGHDAGAVASAIGQARAVTDRPTLVCCKTVIGWGAPEKGGTAAVHGSALGEEEVARAREQLGWHSPAFQIPPEIYAGWDARERGRQRESAWNDLLAAYRQAFPGLAAELERRLRRDLPAKWSVRADAFIADVARKGETLATRKASQLCLEGFGPLLPELIGGSADLTGSNLTRWSGSRALTREQAEANYIHFGVREFAMTAIVNGLALHGGFVPYAGTFLVFSDYARNAVRMAALMRQPAILVYTHDSIGLGEDGPTHQPVEHLASLRLIPRLELWRPCDAVETAVAWRSAIERRDGPTALALSRQSLAHQERDQEQIRNIRKGGYILWEPRPDAPPDVILIATGSEIESAVGAARTLAGQGVHARVVSMPCTQLFESQDEGYRELVLPPQVSRRIAVEAGVSSFWAPYVGSAGRVVGLDRFGESAPGGVLREFFGFSADHVAAVARELLA